MSAAKADKTAQTRDALTAVREFDRAILAHTTWLKQLHTGLICGTPPTPATCGQMRITTAFSASGSTANP